MSDTAPQSGMRSHFLHARDALVAAGARITEPHPAIEDHELRMRARLLLAVIAGLVVLDVGYGAWSFSGSRLLSEHGFDENPHIVLCGFVFLLAVYWLARTRHFLWAGVSLVVVATAVLYLCVVLSPDSSLYLGWLLLGPLLGTLFFSARMAALLLLGVFVGVVALPWVTPLPAGFDVVHGLILLVALGAAVIAVAIVRQRDLSRLKGQAARLAENEARYQTLVDLSPLAVLVNAKGRYVFANKAAAALYGTDSPEEIVGRAALDFIHPDNREAVASRAAQVLAGIPTQPSEIKVLRIDDTTVEAEGTGSRIDFDGDPACLVMLRDLTTQKRTEAELLLANSQLAQSQKMEAVGQLAGGIAHDFNNLLTAILGYSDLLLGSGGIESTEHRADILEIKRAAERGGSLTRQILAYSRRQALEPRLVSVNTVIDGMAPLLHRTLGEHIELVLSLDPDLGACEIDVHQFEQVIVNLAVNARDAMVKGGRLVIETANVDTDRAYVRAHPDATPGPQVMVSVTDTGSGMDESIRKRVFEPFFTTKAPGEGTGLGLATVNGIVTQSGGSVDVRSRPGLGSCFTVRLPRIEREVSEVAALPTRSSTTRGSESILLVEDEDTLRSLMARMLRGLGYTVHAAGDAAAGLEMVESNRRVPDVLVSDITLPGALQGTDLAREVRARYPRLPIVLMSGYAFRTCGDEDWMKDHRFLQKPFPLDRLATTVREVLDARL